MTWIAIAVAVAGNLGYHLSQKSMRHDADPWLSLSAAYAVALVACATVYLAGSGGLATLRADSQRLSWSSVGVGLAIVGIEIGFLLAYRAGWRLNTASVVVNVTVGILLVPLAWMLFTEGLSMRRGAGIALALAALALLAGE